MEDSQGPLVTSPSLSDVLRTSSVELSPSHSSGGTYMWDEDGLEPFVGTGTHQCDSYDNSELNSMVSNRALVALGPDWDQCCKASRLFASPSEVADLRSF